MGIIIGLLTAILLLVIEIYLEGHLQFGKSGIMERISNKINKHKPKGVHIIPAMTDVQIAQEKIIEENDKRNIDTQIADL